MDFVVIQMNEKRAIVGQATERRLDARQRKRLEMIRASRGLSPRDRVVVACDRATVGGRAIVVDDRTRERGERALDRGIGALDRAIRGSERETRSHKRANRVCERGDQSRVRGSLPCCMHDAQLPRSERPV